MNIYRNMREAFQTFDYISERGNFGWASREAGERRRGLVGGSGGRERCLVCGRAANAVHPASSKLKCRTATLHLPLLPLPHDKAADWCRCLPRSARVRRHARVGHQLPLLVTLPRNALALLCPAARVCGATLMWGISGKLKKKYGVEGDVREVLYEVGSFAVYCCEQWNVKPAPSCAMNVRMLGWLPSDSLQVLHSQPAHAT